MMIHPFSPLYDEESEILILGSFPSVKSREEGFYYGHPRNRFWKVVASVFNDDEPGTVEDKSAFLHRNHIALWDVICSCEIEGSSDSSIRNVEVNDLGIILHAAKIREIYVNGKTAYRFYQKYTQPLIQRPAVCLPSSSPANAAWNMERLLESWRRIIDS